MDVLGIITAVIGFTLIFSIMLFTFSITRNWGNIYKIYWGFVVFMCSHLLLFSVVAFSETTTLPPLLNTYTIGVLDLLGTLISFSL